MQSKISLKMKFSFMRSVVFLLLLLLSFSVHAFAAYSVTHDRRSLIIDGQRRLVISASIHYPRSVPEMWPGLVQLAKEGGADAIETYVFWNGHELSPGNYNFGGRFDLLKFVKIVQEAGMYLILRIGPYIAAEYNFGGVPVWLHFIPGTVFRTDNEQWKFYVQNFTTYIVNMMKQERLFGSQGGPIIMSQVENEYGYYEKDYGAGGMQYVVWAANMAVSQNIGVPWVMCQQWDTPEPVINTCNSFYCDDFSPISQNAPKMWTENWPGWYRTFGSGEPHRPVEDVSFSVARFFQKGGSLMNYYMYHGGTNFDRTAGGPFITTSYDYEAPIDEYGLVRQPKWGHLKELHKVIKLCEQALLNTYPVYLQLGPLQELLLYNTSGACAAFISNSDERDDKTIQFQNATYHLPAWSVSILPDCKNVAFNTAKVRSQTSRVEMVPENDLKDVKWEVFVENVGSWGEANLTSNSLLDHINTTKDTTDYLWYTTSVMIDESEAFLKNGSRALLLVESKGHALHAFVNRELQGSAYGNGSVSSYKFRSSIPLKAGRNEIALLSMTVGLQNAGSFYEWVGAGLSSVKIDGFNNGTMDLSTSTWSYKIGLQGEHQGIYREDGSSKVYWAQRSETQIDKPLTWYKAVVDPPPGDEPVALDMINMVKGQAWLNGKEIGRYWTREVSKDEKCVENCDYRGIFLSDKCITGCGERTQRWYHVPRSWFKPSGNTLVIFEEKKGNPTKIRFSRRKIVGACALVGEDYPSFNMESWQQNESGNDKSKPSLSLQCPKNAKISAVKFASFGTPSGSCESYHKGDCDDPDTTSIVEKFCLYKKECTIEVAAETFSKAYCSNTKKLAVEVACS